MEKVLHAAHALVGRELERKDDVSILVSGGAIKEIRTGNAGKAWPVAETVELGEATLLPGLIDGHAHLALDARIPGHLGMMEDSETKQVLRALKSATDDLRKGITGLRCLGDRYYLDVELREAERKGSVPGLPWMQVAGIGMKGLHGHGYVGKGFSGAEEFRR